MIIGYKHIHMDRPRSLSRIEMDDRSVAKDILSVTTIATIALLKGDQLDATRSGELGSVDPEHVQQARLLFFDILIKILRHRG